MESFQSIRDRRAAPPFTLAFLSIQAAILHGPQDRSSGLAIKFAQSEQSNCITK